MHKTRGLIVLFALTTLASTQANAALQCEILPQLFEAYFQNHYSAHTLTDEIKKHTVDQFVKAIDPSKTLLLEGDVQKLKADLPNLFISMKMGNCTQLTDVQKLLVSRAEQDEKFVEGFMNANYKLDESTELVLDADKRTYPKTEEERQALLKKLIHFQISNYLLTKMKLPKAEEQLIHRYKLVTKRVKERKPEDMLSLFAESFSLALDPHSSYMSQDEQEDFQIQMQLSLDGIGASLSSEDGFTVVEEVIPGGAADRGKLLKAKDKIISVTQAGGEPESVIDMDLRDVVKKIRGKRGTKVTLTVIRESDKTPKTLQIAIIRDKIDIKESAAKLTYETRKVGDRTIKIGVIDLPSFYGGGGKGTRNSTDDVKELLDQAKAEKVDGIILKLSRNGGGLLNEAVRLAGLFLKKGSVVATQDSHKRVEVLSDLDEDVAYNGPLEILISRFSASASEILAGALKDYRRSLIVGSDHTFGKGSVQVLQPLNSGLGSLKVTMGMFFLPKGVSTQHLGVSSDVVIPPVFNDKDVGEKMLDYSLLPQSIPPFITDDSNSDEPAKHWNPIDDSVIPALAAKSKERVAKDPKFAEATKKIEESTKNAGLIKLADFRKKSAEEDKEETKEKDADKKSRKKKSEDLEQPEVDEAVSILADYIAMKEPAKASATLSAVPSADSAPAAHKE